MAIVYIHTRNDTNEPFYIGVGVKEYRSVSKRNRNKYWLNIANKVGYKIDIVAKNISYSSALELEIFLIECYGRKIDNSGLLVNMTKGGEGSLGLKSPMKGKKHSDETKQKIGKCHRGKTLSLNQINKIKKINSKQIIQYDLDGNQIKEFRSIRSASIELNIKEQHISRNTLKKRPSTGGFVFLLKNDVFKKHISKKGKPEPILQYDLNKNFIKKWNSSAEAEAKLGIDQSSIRKVIKGKYNTAGGYIWVKN